MSRVENNNGGTRTPIQVDGIINYSSHEKGRGKNRNRKVVWFNPPFCRLANINIGKYFLHLLDKHFNRDNPLSRIFNRNTVKISYSCTKNMYDILSNHNKRLLDELITRDRNPDMEFVIVGMKKNAPWADAAIREMSYTRHVFLLWNSKGMGTESIQESPWEIGSKGDTTTNIYFPTQNLDTRLLYQNIFGALRIGGYLHKLNGK